MEKLDFKTIAFISRKQRWVGSPEIQAGAYSVGKSRLLVSRQEVLSSKASCDWTSW